MESHNLVPFFVLLFILLPASLFTEIKAQQDKDGPFVGVNIGTDVSNLLSAADLVAFLQLQKITHVRLYDADAQILKALAKTKIRVIVSVPNNQLLAIGSSNATAATWIGRNVAAYYPDTLITGIAVGDEVLTTIPSSAPLLMPAIESLYSALVAANLHSQIKISTPSSASIILDPFPPSQAFFNQSLSPVITQLLQFLSRTQSPLMMNLYPYYVFMQNKGVVPLDNSLFKPLTPSKEMVDPNTLLHYTNVLDAMIDSVYFSMKNLNVTDVVVLVTETGWPSRGDSKEPYATIDNADTYNSNLIKHVFDRSGTPLHPEITSSVYIYELFNEDLRSPPVSEANWGLFYGNTTPVYLLHVSGSGTFLANDTTNQTYCIAADGIDAKTLQTALDWACGPGRANCSEIQPGQSCYQPNNVKNHASYAFDSYYQKEGKSSGSCDFKGAAMITTTDPSHGNCIFPGRAQSILFTFHLPRRSFRNPLKTLSEMSSWTCSMCTFINPPSQKSHCEICLSAQPQPAIVSSSTTSPSSPSSKPMWSCALCTFLNPYSSTICEICGNRASASMLSTLELDDDDLGNAQLGSSVGSVFLPLRTCGNTKKGNGENPVGGGDDTGCSGELKGVVLRRDHVTLGNGGCQNMGDDGSGKLDAEGNKGLSAVLQPCVNKRKDREVTGVDGSGNNAGGSSGFRAVKAANQAVQVKPLATAGETHLSSECKPWKLLSYNVWFREDLEMHKRMKALGDLIELHSPDVMCFQEVTPSFYGIFQKSGGGSDTVAQYQTRRHFLEHISACSYPNCRLNPIAANPSITLSWAENFVLQKLKCDQANEAVRFLEKNQNVIFCGDMNWDDKLDGPFPLLEGWVDAWTELRPGEVGWTYDTKSNKMLSGNRTLQKRLDRFVCKLKDLKISEIEMIGKDAIPGLSYIKEKRVKGQVKELVLPVLPSDHYGMLLTIRPSDSTY
ncbi:UNVERIFIED_CONTAM: Glucan endo-1,3-beta-glucosidase 1 [Sesamum angustifolium]|uniref:glucan endo-1,3-beta-D-glucosidase n=1 Tax=Sesamum angustifolium TaxID=2727405 RepID=A0AAW2IVH7_9LAMI